ncbi:hypothetical protein OUZ56_026429 [Daphnia magna]|uniref:CxC3 like cysteine cluster domain-containing protein n=1 Tax=Daphnia magna TaxID=35525 RepID=A0ABQ9ZLR7_9CRUS|nr:hypothetical protein OUZ56_026429 [Daphnia magna]
MDKEASTSDYICSVSLNNNDYLCEEENVWYHGHHQTPGTSQRKFIKSLERLSVENGRAMQHYFY